MFYDPEINMFDAGMCVVDLHESTDPLPLPAIAWSAALVRRGPGFQSRRRL